MYERGVGLCTRGGVEEGGLMYERGVGLYTRGDVLVGFCTIYIYLFCSHQHVPLKVGNGMWIGTPKAILVACGCYMYSVTVTS